MTIFQPIKKILPVCLLAVISLCTVAQPAGPVPPRTENNGKARPYKILTSGRQITVRSSQTIESIMVWTSGGHRVLEEKDLQKSEYQFQLTVPARAYFIMLRMSDGKSYSEKIGIQ